MPVKYLGTKNGRPHFDIGDGAPPKWLIESIAPVKAGKPLAKRAVLLDHPEGLIHQGTVYRPGDEIPELSDRFTEEAELPEKYSAIDQKPTS